MNQYPVMISGPLYAIIKFLAFIGLLTIFGLGVFVGLILAQLY